MPFWKTREQARRDGSAMYTYGSKDAIKDFVGRHGSAATRAIVEYMDHVYGLSEAATREHLSDLKRDGDLTALGGAYAATDFYNGDDGT